MGLVIIIIAAAGIGYVLFGRRTVAAAPTPVAPARASAVPGPPLAVSTPAGPEAQNLALPSARLTAPLATAGLPPMGGIQDVGLLAGPVQSGPTLSAGVPVPKAPIAGVPDAPLTALSGYGYSPPTAATSLYKAQSTLGLTTPVKSGVEATTTLSRG